MFGRAACGAVFCLMLAACSPGGQSDSVNRVFAPALDPGGDSVDGLVVGHRLMEAGEHELALSAFTRAAGNNGIDGEVLMALGSANLQLGRLHQAETLLRRATEEEPDWAEAWNNLGIVLMERDKTGEAVEIFRRAYALDDGQSDSIRDNLRLALANLDNSSYDGLAHQDFRLVRRGSSSYLVRRNDEKT